MPMRIPWDDFEIALMFEIYGEMSEGLPLNAAAQKLSRQLRQKAINQGTQIDDIFRNTNGMVFYLKRTEYLFTDGKSGLDGAQKNVVKMYELYQKNQLQYQRILQEAQHLAGLTMQEDFSTSDAMGERNESQIMGDYSQETQDRFAKWLSGRVSATQLSELYQAITLLDEFCTTRGILRKPLFQITEVRVLNKALTSLESNKVFKMKYRSSLPFSALRQYISFVKENDTKLLSLQTSNTKKVNAIHPKITTFVETPVIKDSPKDTLPDNDTSVADTAVVDFSAKQDYSFTTPCSVSYFGDVSTTLTWQQVYMKVLTCLFEDYPSQADRLKGKKLKGSTRILFGDKSQALTMLRAKPVSNTGIYAEMNFSANSLVRLTGMLLDYFCVDAENVVIKYLKAETRADESEPASPHNASSTDDPAKKSSACRSTFGVYSDDKQTAFRQWMQANGMSSSTGVVYSNALNQCSQFALEKGFSLVDFYQMSSPETVLACRDKLMADAEFSRRNARRNNQFRAAMTKYYLFAQETGTRDTKCPSDAAKAEKPADPRWKEILEKDFPDGYILNDFLCQFQAAGIWQERFGEACPLEGEAIDQAVSACGTVKDGHVFIGNENESKLLAEIADLVADTLKTYSNIYTSQVYQRYRGALVPLSIFTEKVMVQQVMQHAAGRFIFTYSYLFSKPGDTTITEVDCARALRNHGGMMTTDEVADELWFIPRDKVSHYLSVNTEIINTGTGQWMLAEHFPFSREDASQVAQMFDEQFLSQEYILSRDIPSLLDQHLPFIAENVSGLSFAGLFNIICYYLRERFGFTRSIVTPAGVQVDFSMLFSAYAREHDTFTMNDLDAYAKELHHQSSDGTH